MSGTKQHHEPRPAVTKPAQLGKLGCWGNCLTCLTGGTSGELHCQVSTVRNKDATRNAGFPFVSKLSRDKKRASSGVIQSGEKGEHCPMSIRRQHQQKQPEQLTGWPVSLARQLLF